MNSNVDYQLRPEDYSYHAVQMSVQRRINGTLAKLAIEFGEMYHAGKGATAHWLNRKSVEKIKVSRIHFTDAVNVAVILSADGKIVTVMYCESRVKHWKRAA